MAIRYLKIVLVVIVSLLCLAYATQNVVNIDAAYQAFAYVLGNVDHVLFNCVLDNEVPDIDLLFLDHTVHPAHYMPFGRRIPPRI